MTTTHSWFYNPRQSNIPILSGPGYCVNSTNAIGSVNAYNEYSLTIVGANSNNQTANAVRAVEWCESPGSIPSNFVGFQYRPAPNDASDLIIKCLFSGNLPSSTPNYQPPNDSVGVGFPGVGRIEAALNDPKEGIQCYRYKLSPYTSSPTSSPTKNPVKATAAPTKNPITSSPTKNPVKATAAPTKKPVGGNPSPTMKPTVSSKSSKGSKSSSPNSKSAKNAKRV